MIAMPDNDFWIGQEQIDIDRILQRPKCLG